MLWALMQVMSHPALSPSHPPYTPPPPPSLPLQPPSGITDVRESGKTTDHADVRRFGGTGVSRFMADFVDIEKGEVHLEELASSLQVHVCACIEYARV